MDLLGEDGSSFFGKVEVDWGWRDRIVVNDDGEGF